jgi:hypothetical protein
MMLMQQGFCYHWLTWGLVDQGHDEQVTNLIAAFKSSESQGMM